MINFNEKDLRNKIYGCWIGKSIGGTLGGPFEGRREILDVKGYTTPAGEPLPNDDLDLQLIWLKALTDRGPKGVTAQVLGEYWLNYIPPPWGEYGVCKMNLHAGFPPPLSGMLTNEVLNKSNGAWIRSEIWACVAPGCPDTAIRFAYEDASVDHGGDEGMYAELFTAALESAAFVVSDMRELIRIGLSKIPAACRVATAVKTAIKAYEEKHTWQEAREAVVAASVPEIGWFQAPANIGFVIVGWLYGEGDFGKSLIIATNCGDDTDCTASTLGSILGIIRGADTIPQEWIKPIGDRIITVAIDRGSIQLPTTLTQLTEQTMRQIVPMLTAFHCPVTVSASPTDISDIASLKLENPSVGAEICGRSSYAVTMDAVHAKVILDYEKAPVLRPGVPFRLTVEIDNQLPDHRHYEVIWHMPPNVRVLPSPRMQMSIMHKGVEQGYKSRGYGKVHTPAVFEIVADTIDEAYVRGILEVRAPGRPTVCFIPVLFANAVS
ncbi:MAG: ADP-ribosylglycohydrolase family protein [Spirochaetota bacterium]